MTPIKLTFLGTSCSAPTKDRNLSSVALRHAGSVLLFDCPEGTQRQMMMAGVSYMRVQHVFLSHLHADHILGLPGLIATMSMHMRDAPLFIYGPHGTKERVKKALELALMRISFEVVCKEIRRPGLVLEGKDFTVQAVALKHDVPCFGYVFEEQGKKAEFMRKKAEGLGIPVGPLFSKLADGQSVKVEGKTIKPEQVLDYSKARAGRKISIIADTRPGGGYVKAIAGSDVLVHESSFAEKLKARAKETAHSTAKAAGAVAAKANCRKLVLTHISPRHKQASELENEAREEFGNVVVAKDLMEIEI